MAPQRERVVKTQLDDETWQSWRISHIRHEVTAVAALGALIRYWLSLDADGRRQLLDTFGEPT